MKQRILVFVLCLSLFSAVSGGIAAAQREEYIALPVLMYHQMTDRKGAEEKYIVSTNTFKADLAYLRSEGYESITLRELLAWYAGEGELPDKPVLITFDDGYESTLIHAGPLLREYGFTAVVAVIGSVADRYSESPDHNLDYSHLSWEAVREMSEGDVFEIQCHSYDLHSLDGRRGCAPKKWEKEWAYHAVLQRDLQTFLNRCRQYDVNCVMSIAFPFGSYTKSTLEAVKALGFQAAFTCEEKINHLTGDGEELYQICRFNRPGGVSTEEFFEKWK